MNAIVTGCAGFIGSHLTDALLAAGHRVIGYDNLSTGKMENLATAGKFSRFRFIKRDLLNGIDVPSDAHVIFHLAALGSVPRSIQEPVATHRNNTEPLLHIMQEAKQLDPMPRIVFASSSAVYGDHINTTRREHEVGEPMSPYAASKQAQEAYAEAFAKLHGLTLVGLRYFNVFGPRQASDSAYAAVIPKWAMAMLKRGPVEIFGPTDRARDFTPVQEVVRATITAGLSRGIPEHVFTPLNVGTGKVHTLGEVFDQLRELTRYPFGPALCAERPGDPWLSCADISEAYHRLGYEPKTSLAEALSDTVTWMKKQRDAQASEQGLH